MSHLVNKGFSLVLAENEEASLSDRLTITEKEVPKLTKGEVLIEVLAAPVNPSDLVYLMGKYGIPPVQGNFAGFEACGVVIETNAGMYGKWLKGKRVALFATPGKDGTWAKYVVTKTPYCIPLRKDICDEQGATLVVNPMTSVCLVERAIELKAKAVVVNAAASQVGKGIIRYCKLKGIPTITTVRSEANVDVLKKLGANEVLLATSEDFEQSLKEVCTKYSATVFFDSVADKETPRVLKCMPNGSTAIVYGRLTETHDPIGGFFSVADVIFRDINVEGFWLSTYIKKSGALKVYKLTKQVQKLFAEGVFQTDIYGNFNYDEFPDALEHYANHKSDGKVIFNPN